MKALANLLSEIVMVIVLVIISAVFMRYYETKQAGGGEINITKEVAKEFHQTINDAKEGWNEAKKDSIK